MANHLSFESKVLVLSLLSEGNSIRSTERLSGVHRDTIMRLLVSAGETCSAFMDSEMRNLSMKKLQVDEIWTYVGKHQRFLHPEQQDGLMGDQYCFVAMDSDSKLIPSFRLGKRNAETADAFMKDLAARITTRFQLTTDSFPPYRDVVDGIWGADIDYGQVVKSYAQADRSPERRYSPASIVRVDIIPVSGSPRRKHISTSHIERQNLSMRISMRRFTRLTNAYSKKWDNLKAALSLYFWFYDFGRVHETLRVTPAMEAGISKRILTWHDLFNWQEQRIAA
ncbi:MAG: IS1 family transposase [Bacteroidota bacterium]